MALDPDGCAEMLVDTLVAYGGALRSRITELEADNEVLQAQLAEMEKQLVDVQKQLADAKANKDDPYEEARAHMDTLFNTFAAALNTGDPCEVEPAMDAIKAFARGDAKEFDFGGENVRTHIVLVFTTVNTLLLLLQTMKNWQTEVAQARARNASQE